MIRIQNAQLQKFEQEHIDAVRAIAPECTLFLKKSATFQPVKAGKVALYGSGARHTIKGGTGSGDVNVRHFTTIEEGLEKAGFTVTSKAWLDAYDTKIQETHNAFVAEIKREAAELGISAMMHGLGKAAPEPDYEFPLDAEGDIAIYVLSRISGEGADRTVQKGDILLTETEIRDILACRERYKTFVLVLNVGGMVDLSPVMAVENILLLGQLGTPTGDVLADIILGKSYPSGKLAMTWAPMDSYPSSADFGDWNDTVYREGIYVGYRYFDTAGVPVTFPFGFGLSYTSFTLDVEEVTADEKQVSVRVRVKNTGAYPGKEVVQVYTSAPAGVLDKPFQELRTFGKTGELHPGEAEDLVLHFATVDMAAYDCAQAAYILEKGQYTLRVGNSSAATVPCALLVLDETVVIRQCQNLCGPADVTRLQLQRTYRDDLQPAVPIFSLSAQKFAQETVHYSGEPQELTDAHSCTFDDVKSGKASLDQFVASLSNEQLAYLCIGMYDKNAGMGSVVGAASQSVAGAAGETTKQLEDLGVPTLVMADGPAGIRVCTQYKVVGNSVKPVDNPLAGYMEFIEPELLEMLMASMPQPTEEELSAPINYMYCVAIPIGTALGQSFNRDVCEKLGDIVGSEMEPFGVHIWLSPAMNIQRSPLCGRNFEYYSEDPFLSGMIGASITLGVQKHKGCATTVKHFALNNQETNRNLSNSIADERAIREIYLKTFEICVKQSQPHCIMTSYNLMNGEHTNNRRDLCTNILRDEWGYDGLAMTDWYAVGTPMISGGGHENKHGPGSPAGCIFAGNDLIMPGMESDFQDILSAIGKTDARYPITRAMLQTCAKRVLKLILKLS